MRFDEVLAELESGLLQKIHGFCRLKLGADLEAEDLAQDICEEVLKTARRYERDGREIANLPAFVWSVSNRRFAAWVRRKKRGAVDLPGDAALNLLPSGEDTEETVIAREQAAILRRELARLSRNWREAVVLCYFDGLTAEEIAGKVGRSPGTVRWWLHQARAELGKGMNMAREYGEKSFRPGRLVLSCQGNPGADMEPVACAQRLIAQNILLAAYRTPLTPEELSDELGVSAAYLEDELSALALNELMKEEPRGKFRTDFVILPDSGALPLSREIRSALFPAYFEKVLSFLEANRETLSSPRFNRAGFTWERLLWVYLHAAPQSCTNRFERENGLKVDFSEMPHRPNGGRWIALGFDNSVPAETPAEGEEWAAYDGPVHKGGGFFAEGFFHQWSGSSSAPFFDVPDGVFALSADLIEGRRTFDSLDGEQKYLFSLAAEKKLWIRRPDGSFTPDFYYIDLETDGELARIFESLYPSLEPLYEKAWDLILRHHEADVPAALRWQMGNFLSNSLNVLVPMCLCDACNAGLLSAPASPADPWLSLFVSGVKGNEE